MTCRSTKVLLVTLAIVAFSLRIGTVIYFKGWYKPSAMEHRSIAAALVNGKGFTFGDWNYYGPTSVQSPTFPFLLAGLFKIFGLPDGPNDPHNAALQGVHWAYFSIQFINALAGAGLVFLTYKMARTLGANETAALIAAATVAIWPTQIYAARAVQAISLITCGVAGMIILYYSAIRSGRTGPWVGFSILAAFTTLTEPVYLPVILATCGLVLVTLSLPLFTRLKFVAILGFACIAIIGPWTMRNYVVHDHLIPIKGSFWVNMWKGNNDFATGTDRLAMTDAEKKLAKKQIGGIDDDNVTDTNHVYAMLTLTQQYRLKNQPEPARELVFKEFATNWIKAHPQKYARLCVIRLVKTLTVDWDNPRSVNVVYLGSRIAVLLLSLGGLVVALRQRWSLLFPALIVGVAFASYTLTITAARFAFPFEPIQLCLGGALLAALLEVFTGRRRVDSRPGFAVVPSAAL